MEDMSKKRTGRKSRKIRRGRRVHTGRVVAVTLCAVAVCAAFVCVVIYGAGRIMEQKDSGKNTDITAGEGQPYGSQRLEKSVQENAEESAQQTGFVPGNGQEAEGQQPEEAGQTVPTVSILGDSISTFKDYIPAGYYDFFPENGQVSDVDDTWWKRVIDDKGWTLCVNGSSSGATCAGDSAGTDNPQCGCNEFRTGALYGPDGQAPDVIIVYMGTNDLLQSIPMGDNDGTGQVAEGQVSTFSDAYTLMLDKLLANYPASKIYCCTITQIGNYGTSTPYVEFVNGAGLTAADYSERITRIAGNKGLSVIDLYGCGITVDNLHNTSTDGVHPTPEGMKHIAEAVRKVLD